MRGTARIAGRHKNGTSRSADASGARIAVQIMPPFSRKVSRSWLHRVVETALSSQVTGDPDNPVEGREVGLVITDDATLQDLNRRYRGLDEVTDVLAFSFLHSGQYQGEGEAPTQELMAFPSGESQEEPFGEVIISFPQAESQALQAGHHLHRELALLVIHGLLHLLGYDHAEPEDERAMWKRQDTVLALVLQEDEAERL